MDCEYTTTSVVIATRNRPEALSECLASLALQVAKPIEVIIVDASDSATASQLCAAMETDRLGFRIEYVRSNTRSAAVQRNVGAAQAKGTILVFLDDDVVLEPQFLSEILAIFQENSGSIGGIVGYVTNEIPAPLSTTNRILLKIILGEDPSNREGQLVGPAVQFPYGAGSGRWREVHWLTSCACAYPKHIFEQYQFATTFQGYSFMEDVELSTRVGRNHRLLQALNARLLHKGLGSSSHTDWVAHGKSTILNRHFVMKAGMGKHDLSSLLRLFIYELGYSTAAGIWNGGRGGSLLPTLQQLAGRVSGALDILRDKSPHQN